MVLVDVVHGDLAETVWRITARMRVRRNNRWYSARASHPTVIGSSGTVIQSFNCFALDRVLSLRRTQSPHEESFMQYQTTNPYTEEFIQIFRSTRTAISNRLSTGR